MSRIGRMPIPLPPKVKAAIEGKKVRVEGPKGHLDYELPPPIEARVEGDRILVARQSDEPKVRALHGLSRSLIFNMVKGVSEGYVKRLEIHGVGYRASVQDRTVTMLLGFSRPVEYQLPEGVNVHVEGNTKIIVEGIDKQAVGQVAADLRSFYPPEPYKGKGVRYADEQVTRKEGKSVQ